LSLIIAKTIIGLDGRKMSKSYNNIIPIFLEEKPLRKLINKIKTNSLEPGVPKEYKDCTLFALYAYFATSEEIESIKKLYAEGISWGDMKSILFEKIFNFFDPYRSTYTDYLSDEAFLEKRLRLGGEQAREEASAYLKEIKSAIGIK
jgi:tryptophanyl-tRNA synthetase